MMTARVGIKRENSEFQTAHSALSALVEAMLATNTVALCRYSYNVNSNPRVVCLIPKKNKNSYPVGWLFIAA